LIASVGDYIVSTHQTQEKFWQQHWRKQAIHEFKNVLIKKGEATDFFATDRHKESLQGIVGNVMQSFGGQAVYKSVEEKAAHLLYFIIKNHPFVDGNKRTGAFSFVWYLNRNKRLNTSQLSPSALTAFTILVAESNPAHKENTIKLIMKLIEK
jgi:prophage maintenance system killer protein